MSTLESFNLFIHCRDVLCVLVAQSCPTLPDFMDCGSVPARLLCPLNSPGKNTGVGCHFLPLGNFPTQGSNPGLLHCRWILYYLSRQERPRDVLVSWVDPPANAGDTREAVQSLGQEDSLEEEMATHSSILAWKTPWLEEPGGLQPTGSQRVGHDWASTYTHAQYRIMSDKIGEKFSWDPLQSFPLLKGAQKRK